ncbi:MAG: glycosyltransferase, partial [Bryobacteraceae bacterium]
FKLLTYMACGLPVVASPVGMNAEVLGLGGGLAATSHDDWVSALESVLSGRVTSGARGRQAVLAEYSLAALAPRFAALLSSAGGRA